MHDSESQSAVPDDWFVDPVQLGVPGIRRAQRPHGSQSPDGSVPDSGDGRISADGSGSGDGRVSADGSNVAPDATLAWQSDSLCAQTDPEAFFPEKGGSTRDAKKICTSCEVRAQCLDYALANDERFGIWGGLSERERRKLRKRA